MITYSESNAVKLSATKKDFYQIWNELVEIASKISDRWSPESTNETDPGVVLLKVLTAVADKLNYNIDVNTLEAFLPSAAQEESVRKLCDMLGYSIKYYQSATTKVKIVYNLDSSYAIPKDLISNIPLPRFTNIKDIDDTINYVTTEDKYFMKDVNTVEVNCIEGELIECETDDDNVISVLQLDDNNRYYLPEKQIAENGVFVTNFVNTNTEGTDWDKVDNLNVQPLGTKCYKFSYDSKLNLPYLQFPSDISNIIEDGLKIRYIRTNGVNGNISARTLCRFEKPSYWSTLEQNLQSADNEDLKYLNPDNYVVNNPAAATNGTNIETIDNAYNNYKKTIGTFDTLVTCRDYMNKIYQLTISDTNTNPLVSNVIVSDIRDDINHAVTFCTFGEHGIEYKNIARQLVADNTDYADLEALKTAFAAAATAEDKAKFINTIYYTADRKWYTYIYNGTEALPYELTDKQIQELNHFDLVFYTFTPTNNLNNKLEYNKSFKYDDSNFLEIQYKLKENKTISHNIVKPNKNDIVCIKNYYKLRTKIITTRKVNIVEQQEILENVRKKIYENFNARKVDFGEQIVEDTIKEVIINADARIKDLDWQTPEKVTKVCTASGGEFTISGIQNDATHSTTTWAAAEKSYFNKLALNNILAGRIPLFNYNENFKPEFSEKEYPSWEENDVTKSYNPLYPDELKYNSTDIEQKYPWNGISKIKSEFLITKPGDTGDLDLTLKPNEVVQFRFPNLKTTLTYPAYVNYYFHLEGTSTDPAAAEMQSVYNFLVGLDNSEVTDDKARLNNYVDTLGEDVNTNEPFPNKGLVFMHGEGESNYTRASSPFVANKTYKQLTITDDNFINWTKTLGCNFYTRKPSNQDLTPGRLIDEQKHRYVIINEFTPDINPIETYYIPKDADAENNLGSDGIYNYIKANENYMLNDNEYLLINYTSSTNNENGDNVKTAVNTIITPYVDAESKKKVYPIICPNFALHDSDDWRLTHNYNKTSGWDFDAERKRLNNSSILNPAGMFTLGASDQIEIKDFVQVVLNEAFTNLYWRLNEESKPDDYGKISFNSWNEDPVYIAAGEGHAAGDPVPAGTSFNSETMKYTSYTLQDGEYIYYTDKDKTDLAYYGSGTKITRTIFTPELFKTKSETEPNTEDILSLGLAAAIPWKLYQFNQDSNSHSRALTLTEYEYRTLTEADKLVNIQGLTTNINNDWQKIEAAKYQYLNSEPESLTLNCISGIDWEVRSKLELNFSPSIAQTLNKTKASNKVDTKAIDKLTIYYQTLDANQNKVASEELIMPRSDDTLAIKSNIPIYSTNSICYLDAEDTDHNMIYYPVQVKIFAIDILQDSDESYISLNNFEKGSFTKITFDNITWGTEAAPKKYEYPLNVLIPANNIGLLMIYCTSIPGSGSAQTAFPYLTVKENKCALAIYNNNNAWWSEKTVTGNQAVSCVAIKTTDTAIEEEKDYYTREESTAGAGYLNDGEYKYNKVETPVVDDINDYYEVTTLGQDFAFTKYKLQEGVNLIQFNSSCTFSINTEKEAKDSIVIFGNLDLIHSRTEHIEDQLNPQLHYNSITESTDLAQVLYDINKIDTKHQFYYNAVINNENALDLQYKPSLKEYLDDWYVWYNYNNINNKFVISEIDADSLIDGITIAQNSKL